ncbi:multidrug transporter AcrB [Prevotella sp. P5-92]|uniref:efflux RND transporter permease subunit n=1 Tax=Prevotella sp. P5-92 TaxID=2024222 RepID=UPI000B962207|nr:efflux RND transporter permease subunit [Prevotella sp. P5-92]OYP55103.1 multidrug transporter AcrB [Prevotella sp. P5-92]
MNISKWALNRGVLIHAFVAVLIIGGLWAFTQMPKLEDPAIRVKQALVVATYPGASAHQVELELTDPIEKSIRQMPDIDHIESSSYADMTIITVELHPTVKDDELEQQWDLLRRKVENIKPSLPKGAQVMTVADDFGDVYGMFYALTGDGLSDRQLSDYAELIKREVLAIDGVTRVDIYGKRPECININLKEEKMANLGVLPTEVIQTLNGQNATSYAGYYDNGTRRIRVTVDDKFRSVEDIADMLIAGHDDDQLRIRDIADVSKGYEKVTRNAMLRDGERALGISIACSSSHDILKVGDKVEEKLGQLAKRMPVGAEYNKVFFQPERVSDSLYTFLINLLESVIIVVVVLIFFMGFKSGLILGMSLAVIVFGSFLVLNGFDGTLQRVSLGAFILAMGMLVDNAIVIVDGILVDLRSGKPRAEALTSIGRKTAMPLLGATLIAILAFMPIFLSPDTSGVYVRDLFIVIAVSLLLSWLLALTHVPLMANRLLHPKVSEGEAYKGKAYDMLDKVMGICLRHRLMVVGAAVVLLVGSLSCYPFLQQSFFPDMEYDQLYIEYKLPEGYNSTQVEHDLEQMRTMLMQCKDVTHVTTSIGGTPSRYNLVRSIATPSLAYGELIVDFTSPETLVAHLDSMQRTLNDRFPDAYIKIKRYNLMYKKYPIEICFNGPDPQVLHQLTDSAMAIVRNSDKVCLPTSDWEPQVPVLTVDYNQSAARTSGLSRGDVALSLMSYTDGIPVGTFYDGIHPENIYVKCHTDKGEEVENLDRVNVFGMMPNVGNVFNRSTVQKLMSGRLDKDDVIRQVTSTTPLSQVSKGIDIRWEEPVVVRYNGQRQQRLQCSPAPGVSTESARQSIAKAIESIALPEGYSLSWEGEYKASTQSKQYLFKGFPLSVVMMLLILIMLFNDFRRPAIIFSCIPLVVVGVFPSVLLSGKDFGFVAIVGILGLIGMMIKNGIVLIDEISLQTSQGKPLDRALIDSSKSRLLPVMMASLTTILGMIPLISDSLFGSLAVTIMGGLAAGTVIILIFIPVLYSLMYKRK